MSIVRDSGISSSVIEINEEELTEEINKHLDPALKALHTALLKALSGHLTLSLYQWLYQETEPYLQIAANAGLNAILSVANYSSAIQEKLSLEFEIKPYKSASDNKKKLFHELAKFYKTIILFKTDMGRKILAVKEEKITEYYLNELDNKVNLIKQSLRKPQERILATQNEMMTDLDQLTEEAVLDFHTKKIKAHLQNSINENISEYDTILEELKDSKEDPSQLLSHVQGKINKINESKIEDLKFDTETFVEELPVLFGISQLLSRLESEQEEYILLLEKQSETKKIQTLKEIFDQAEALKKNLLRQQAFLEEISTVNTVNTVNVDPIIDSLSQIMIQQSRFSYHSAWCSEKSDGILKSLENIKRAAMLTNAFSPIFSGTALQTRYEKIHSQFYVLDKIKAGIKEIQDNIENNKIKKEQFKSAMLKKNNELKISLKHKVEGIYRKETSVAQNQLSKIKLQYIQRLKTVIDISQKEISQSNQRGQLIPSPHVKKKFSLPKSRNYLIPGVVNEFLAATLTGLAFAAFMTTTPIGWGIAATLAATCCVSIGTVFLTKAYNRHKKNNLLKQFDQNTQEDLFQINEDLKKEKIDSSTRHFIIKHGMTVDKNYRSQDKDEVAYVMKDKHQIRFFLNVKTKNFHVCSNDHSRKVRVDTKNFQAQLRQFI